jgi:hypothetical protein
MNNATLPWVIVAVLVNLYFCGRERRQARAAGTAPAAVPASPQMPNPQPVDAPPNQDGGLDPAIATGNMPSSF